MKKSFLSFIERDSPVHKLAGSVKLLLFLLWSVLSMVGYDTRIMSAMTIIGIALFLISKIKISDISFIFKMLLIFMFLNLAAIYLFAPEHGVKIYGSRHLLFAGIGRFTITREQLFYELNIFLKYSMIVPPALLLIVTTNPSEFAASLNQAGVSYNIAYAVSLTLRYIPDVQKDYTEISQAQQARGLELSKKTSLGNRMKGAARILLPLLLSTLERINVISAAMELRSFGKYKKRTWYAAKKITRFDIIVLCSGIILFIFGMALTFADGERFYNPFAG